MGSHLGDGFETRESYFGHVFKKFVDIVDLSKRVLVDVGIKTILGSQK